MIRQALAIAGKDLRVEARGREALNTLVPFAGTLLILFGLAFGPGRTVLRAAAPALLWLAVLFAGILALRGAFEAETEDGALEVLLLAPVDRLAIYLGKVVAVTVELVALEALTVFGSFYLFDLAVPADALVAVAAFAVGTVGFVALGTLFAALATRARAREALFPILLLPGSVPVLLGGIRCTELATQGRSSEAGSWLGLLVAFAAVAVAAGVLVFEHLVEES